MWYVIVGISDDEASTGAPFARGVGNQNGSQNSVFFDVLMSFIELKTSFLRGISQSPE